MSYLEQNSKTRPDKLKVAMTADLFKPLCLYSLIDPSFSSGCLEARQEQTQSGGSQGSQPILTPGHVVLPQVVIRRVFFLPWGSTSEVEQLRKGKLSGVAVAALAVSWPVLVSSTGVDIGAARAKWNILADFLKSAFPIDDGGNVLVDKLMVSVTQDFLSKP